MNIKEEILKEVNLYKTGVKNPRSIGNLSDTIKSNFGDTIRGDINKMIGQTFTQKLYNYINNIITIPLCVVCNNVTRFDSIYIGYNKTCCRKCACILKYGVDNPMKVNNIKDKCVDTNTRLYGGIGTGSLQTRLKIFDSYKEKTGFNHPSQNPNNMVDYKEKTGFNHPFSNPLVIENNHKLFFKKYGVDHGSKVSEIKQKMTDSRNKNIIKTFEKIKETRHKNVYNDLKEYYKDRYTLLFDENEYNGVRNDLEDVYDMSYKRYPFKCNKCDTIFDDFFITKRDIKCPKCYPRGFNFENNFYTFLERYNLDIIKHDRKIIKPLELDVVIPNKNIAIEINGLYWHSENSNGVPKNYHLNKTKLCEKVGIKLIHIFEDELLEQEKIVKNRLKHILGLVKYSIFARKCVVKVIDNKIKNKFLNKYHLQGEDKSKISLGCFYKDRLIAVMTFTKSRFNKKFEYELVRYATIPFNCIGVSGKLLKYFERNYNPKSIISYADRRWGTGNLYHKLGFSLDHISTPNYWYIKQQQRFNRYMFQKHKLKNNLSIFDQSISEWENMKNNGYDRIWDCGNYVFVKKYDQFVSQNTK